MKFRVFDTEEKEFVDSTPFYIDSDGTLCIYEFMDGAGDVVEKADKNFAPIFSTGIKDWSGKEYEDGSLLRPSNILYIIYWDKEKAGFFAKTIKPNPEITGIPLYNWAVPIENYEIIGSVHTNPELLEDK